MENNTCPLGTELSKINYINPKLLRTILLSLRQSYFKFRHFHICLMAKGIIYFKIKNCIH
jgi:hypothetical protein